MTLYTALFCFRHWSHVQCDTIIQRLLADRWRRVERVDSIGGNIGDKGKEPENFENCETVTVNSDGGTDD